MRRKRPSGIGSMDRRTGMLRGRLAIAEYCDVSVESVTKLIRDYGMPAATINGMYWTTPSLIDAWLLDQLEMQQHDRRTIDGKATVVDG